MTEWIANLKQVVLVVLVCEFLKELLSTGSFRKYVQFAVSLFLFLFLLSSVFRVEFSLPEFQEPFFETSHENLVVKEYETDIATQIKERLRENNLDIVTVTVHLNDRYELKSVQIYTVEDASQIHAVLKGEFPYEVVYPTEELLDKST